MTDRRKILTGLAAGSAALTSAALGAQAQEPHAHEQHAHEHDSKDCDCRRPHNGPYSDYFPNVVVVTHEGRRALFYNDLLRGKIALVNCMSIANESVYPVTDNLARVQRLLGERSGRDVFIYSISVDPEHDTPSALADFAERHGAGPGWLFLTGTSETVSTLRARLFGHTHGKAQDCSMGLVRYGNEAVGLWGSVPAKADAEWIARRVSWVTPRGQAAGTFRRRGPLPVPAKDTRRS